MGLIGVGYCVMCGRFGTHDREMSGALQCIDLVACRDFRAEQRHLKERIALGIPWMYYSGQERGI